MQQIAFILCTLVLRIGPLSGQSTTPSEALITLNGTFQRNLFTPLSTTQVVVFQNLIPGEAYLLSVPDHADLCRPDLVAPDLKNAQYDAAAHVLRFTATASDLRFQLNYPCVWEAAHPPAQYLSLVCETCAKKELKQYLKSLSVLEVSTGITAEDLVRNILVGGDCFDISNVTFKGKGDQIGTFSNGASNIGFSAGAIIATGDCSIATGPNDQDSASGGYGESTPDSDLSLMSGSSSNFDLADIEFDIIPTQTPLTFEYVFASEEYCEYVGTTFRDALGFFISGPGISGPYSDSAQNIAVLASGTPVTVNNVNHISNSGFYTNNTPASGNLCGQNPSSSPAVNEVQYDGFTKKLTATASVIPCEKYHIKMKICDVGDGIFDSAVFLKGGDLGSGKNASVDWVVNGQTGQNTATEGSGTVELLFRRVGGNLNAPLLVSYQILGTATQAADFTGVPVAAVVIPAGQSTLALTVNILNDMIAEGPESISIKLSNGCSCVNPLATLTILDPVPPSFLLTSAVNNVHVCAGTDTAFTVHLTSISGYNNPVNLAVTGAPADATVTISPNPAGADDSVSVNISGLETAGNYTITITAVSGSITRTDSVALSVSSGIPGVPIAISPTNGASGLPTTTLLHWASAPAADSYWVEVATNPSFSAGAIVSSQTVNDTSVTLNNLQTETVYYWRAKAINACESGTYSPIYAFQTGKNLCNQQFGSTDVPKEIPAINDGSESWATASNLNIAVNKPINDINVSLAFTQHNIGDLSAWLITPFDDSIGVQLFDRPGFPATTTGCTVEDGTLTFDTDSGPGVQEADALETQCDTATPPLTGTYKPIESLNSLNGKYTAGWWKLRVVTRHGGGAITGWSLSFCLSEATAAGNILANAPLIVSAGQNETILQSNLNMGMSGSPEQGIFTLLSRPQHGALSLNGVALEPGDQFSQADINDNLLIYNNNCDGTPTDHFRFDALDKANKAWVHNAVFNISIMPGNLSLTAGVQKTIRCAGDSNGEIIATGSGGQMPYFYSLNGGMSQTSNIFSNLAAGTYTVMVTDNSACNAASSTTATLTEPQALQISTSVLSDMITVQTSGGTAPYSYSLNGNAPQSSGVFSGLEAGIYAVTCTDANGCTVSATNLVVITGAIEPSETWGLTISPNPGDGLFNLTMKHAPETLRAEVFDVTGRLMQSLNLQSVGGQLTTTLNLQHLPTGAYFLRLCDGQKWGGVRLFKENGR